MCTVSEMKLGEQRLSEQNNTHKRDDDKGQPLQGERG